MSSTDTHISVTVYGHDEDGQLWASTKNAIITGRAGRDTPTGVLATVRQRIQEQAERDLQEKGIPVERIEWRDDEP